MSAQVVLRSASGRAFDPGAAITAENVKDYLPSPSTIAGAQRGFAEAGFEVSNVVGNSFSITAPASTFEKVFKVTLRSREGKGVMAIPKGSDAESYELPLGALREELARYVEAVTFTPPPDFGPTSY